VFWGSIDRRFTIGWRNTGTAGGAGQRQSLGRVGRPSWTEEAEFDIHNGEHSPLQLNFEFALWTCAPSLNSSTTIWYQTECGIG
jgi:hypothetical protein